MKFLPISVQIGQKLKNKFFNTAISINQELHSLTEAGTYPVNLDLLDEKSLSKEEPKAPVLHEEFIHRLDDVERQYKLLGVL